MMRCLWDNGVTAQKWEETCLGCKLGQKLSIRESTAFWDDNWIGGKVLKYSFPCTYALETEKEVTVNSKMSDTRLENSLRRSIRGEGSEEFSVASIRKIIDDNYLSKVDTRTLWIKYVPIKVNVLAWKIKIEALPTRFNISRRDLIIGVSLDVKPRSVGRIGLKFLI
nr:hypothetical protein [Tanacetum cinerariifolium]